MSASKITTAQQHQLAVIGAAILGVQGHRGASDTGDV